MAEYGKANREVVQNLINNLRQFKEYVDNELKIMIDRTEKLGETWQDAQYNQFNGFINDLCCSLKRDLEIVNDTADKLQGKLNLY